MDFDAAVAAVMHREGAPATIGRLKEKVLHATLKLWLCPDTACHEVTLSEGRVADIFDGTTVTEIQTGSLSPLRGKLAALLDTYPVTVVMPLVRRKYLCWVDPATGEVSPARRSPRVGTLTDAAAELVYLLPLLEHPHLRIRLLLMDMEEHRLADGWGKGGHRGSHRAERYPLTLEGDVTLTTFAQYGQLLPPALPPAFTAAQFGKAAHLKGRRLSAALKVLLHTGVLTRTKEGRGYLYQTVSSKPS